MANDNTGRPVGEPERDPYEPRTREGTYRDRRHGGMEYKGGGGGMEYRGTDYGMGYDGQRIQGYPYGNPGYQGGNPYGRKGRQEYPGYSNDPWDARPYYGRAGGYEGHVDVDPDLLQRLVRKVRQLERERDGGRKSNTPRVQHYVIGR